MLRGQRGQIAFGAHGHGPLGRMFGDLIPTEEAPDVVDQPAHSSTERLELRAAALRA